MKVIICGAGQVGWQIARQLSSERNDVTVVDFNADLVRRATDTLDVQGIVGFASYPDVLERAGARDADLIIAASSATTTRLAQNAYAGMTADQVRFVGAIGADPGVIVVAADSPYQTLNDLVDAILAEPGSVAFAGGSAVGGFDHLKPLMVLKEAGFTDITKVKYIGVDGGADAITQTVGGFTQAMTGDMSEVVSFLANGDIRVVAVLTDERVPGFDDIPTAKEQGFDVVAVNWRGLYIPKGVSDATFDEWAGKLQAVADSDEWAQAMMDNGLAPFTKVGGDFQSYVDGLVADINAMSKELGVIQ